MAEANFVQTSFLGGEWSQTMQGRIDRPDYRTAMNTCLNGLPVEQGKWTRRPGFGYAAHTRGGVLGRLIKFSFQQNAPYTMEFTAGHLRFFVGNTLATTNDQQAVVAISTANPAVVQTTTAHGWSTGDQGMFNTLGTVDPLLLNRQFIFTNVDSTHVSLADALTGTNIDGSTLQAFTTGNITRTLDLVTPYLNQTWATTRSVQTDKAAVLLNGLYAPQVLGVVTPPTGSASAVLSLNPAKFVDGPYLNPVTNGAQLTPSAVSGVINLTLTFSSYVSTQAYSLGDYVVSSSVAYQSLINGNVGNTPASSPADWAVVSPSQAVGVNGFVATDLGRHIRLCYEPALWTSGGTYAAGQTVTYGAQTYWTSLTASNTGNVPGVDTVHWAINPTGSVWTWGTIQSLLNVIPSNQTGDANIGNLTQSGGLAAAFDGVFSKVSTAAAEKSTFLNVVPPVTNYTDSYVGKNFTGTVAGAYAVSSVTVFPPTDTGFAEVDATFAGLQSLYGSLQLYGSQTAPTGTTTGTLLGSVNLGYTDGYLNQLNLGFAGISIPSSDVVTTWKYLWVRLIVYSEYGAGPGNEETIFAYIGQVQFIAGGTAINSAGVSVAVLGTPLLGTSNIRTWRLGLYNGTTGWPTCGTYHEGRLLLSGSVKNRLDGSQPNQDWATQISFAPTGASGAVADNNAISYTFNAADVNTILGMKSEQQGVVVATEKGEWLVQATTLNQPLTPTSIQAHQVTRIGSALAATAEMLFTDHTIVFIQRYARKLMEYFPDIFSGKYSAPNLALTADHLTSRGLVEIAYQQNTSPVIWARCADGSLLGCSYKRDSLMSSQGPTFAGWHQHSHGGTRTLASISDGPTPDGTLDTLAVVSTDGTPTVPGTTFHVEFMNQIFQETDAGTSACFLDDFIVPAATQNVTVGGKIGMQCAGLWHLNGHTATVFAGGLDCGDWPVANGVLNVPYGNDPAGLFTAAFAAGFSPLPVIVGFTYNSDGQIVRPNTQQEALTRSGPAFGRMGRIAEFAALLSSTQAISFGTDFSKLDPAAFTDAAGNPFAANALFSGTYWSNSVQDDSSRDGSKLCWRITRPYPATIAAISGVIQAQG